MACTEQMISGKNSGNEELKAKAFMHVANVKVWKLKNNPALFYEGGMKIDADGSPRAYHPENKGLDHNYNGGSGGHWWGVITNDEGKPVIQGPEDPAPGYYVSCTSLTHADKDKYDPAKYINAEVVPYIVLPERLFTKGNIKLGDFAAIVNKKNGKIAYAIFADIGPAGKLGEGSIALANNLGIDSSPKDGGADEDVIYIVFPGSGNGEPRDLEEIHSYGPKLLKQWGGQEQLMSFFP
ncbi:MAG: glycoside hydrolase family 75 protein [Cytophagaceae bacterium]